MPLHRDDVVAFLFFLDTDKCMWYWCSDSRRYQNTITSIPTVIIDMPISDFTVNAS